MTISITTVKSYTMKYHNFVAICITQRNNDVNATSDFYSNIASSLLKWHHSNLQCSTDTYYHETCSKSIGSYKPHTPVALSHLDSAQDPCAW